MFNWEYDAPDYADQVKLENQMYHYEKDLKTAFSRIVHPKYLDALLRITAHAYINEENEAYDLADNLKVTKLHFLAYLGEEEKFYWEMRREQDDNFILHIWEDV